MRWFGIGLAIAGVIGGLVGWLVFQNLPVLIGGGVLMLIGIIILISGTRTVPK
jgi:hypothetical protein